jgi:type VII secretion-associated serine protease mycosin
MRGTKTVMVAVLGLGVALVPPQVPSRAASGCGATRAPAGSRLVEVPWAQLRYQPARLAGLANGTGVRVAVLDSGVDAEHPQLRGQVLPGTDELTTGGSGRRDCVSHGTAVASIIAARPGAGVPFLGLAPGARILPVRVTEQEVLGTVPTGRAGTLAGLVAAVRWAVDHDAQVLNLSLVLYQDAPELRAAIDYARRHDVVVVAATGNEHGRQTGPDRIPYPAGYPGVIGVGAIGPDGVRLADSPVGPFVDVMAPGGGVTAAVPGGGLSTFDGTSFAAPFVSATAALLRQREPGLSAAAVTARIVAAADPAPGGAHSDAYGFGILNPYRTVTETLATHTPAAPPAVPAGAARPAGHRGPDGRRAVELALGGLGTAGLILLGAAMLRRGSRRGWRPGRG